MGSGMEATLFAAVLSVQNLAVSIGALAGAGLTAALKITTQDWSNLWVLVVVCNVCRVVPLALLWPMRSTIAAAVKMQIETNRSHDSLYGAITDACDTSSSTPAAHLSCAT